MRSGSGAGSNRSGTWTALFGDNVDAHEVFMARRHDEGCPGGGDVYFRCRVPAGESGDAVVGVFENVRAAMPDPASRLVIVERVVVDETRRCCPRCGTCTC